MFETERTRRLLRPQQGSLRSLGDVCCARLYYRGGVGALTTRLCWAIILKLIGMKLWNSLKLFISPNYDLLSSQNFSITVTNLFIGCESITSEWVFRANVYKRNVPLAFVILICGLSLFRFAKRLELFWRWPSLSQRIWSLDQVLLIRIKVNFFHSGEWDQKFQMARF